MICTNCGAQNKRKVTVCAFCRRPMTPTNWTSTPPDPLDLEFPRIGEKPQVNDKPLSPWSYLGYQLLFAIPLIGWIFLIVFSCSRGCNANLRNFARSYWCALLVGLILLAAWIGLLFALGGLSSFQEFFSYYFRYY